jgi:hypothetical protein
MSTPSFVSHEENSKIVQAMQNMKFSYQSIFSIDKIYEDEKISLKHEVPTETAET